MPFRRELVYPPPSHLADPRSISVSASHNPVRALKSLLVAFGLMLSLAVTHANACFLPQGQETGLHSVDSEWVVVEAQYNPDLGTWEVLDAWSDSEAGAYSPQTGDLVFEDESGNIEIIYIKSSVAGGGGGGGGGDGPPIVIQGTDGPPIGIQAKNKRSGTRMPVHEDHSDLELTCLNPITDTVDRILVIGQRTFLDFGWLGYIGIGRGSHSGGDGGGGGSGVLRLRLGLIAISASQWAELSASIWNATRMAALNDIERFRQYGDHIPYAPGSVINWANAQVNWNLYGANNPNLSNEDVLANLIADICC